MGQGQRWQHSSRSLAGAPRAQRVERRPGNNLISNLRYRHSGSLTNSTGIFTAFSFSFHKEVLSSTVSAQASINFRLRLIRYSRRVLTVQTGDALSLLAT